MFEIVISLSLIGTPGALLAHAPGLMLDPQSASTAPPPSAPAQASTPAATPAATPLTDAQLAQIVAPIALYPDALLSQIFMASTYPLQVIEADRWVKANPSVTGTAAEKALEAQPWDPSVKSLVNFPTVLDMMSKELTWTQQLGDAFVTDQKATMDAVQKLRAKAKAEGNLNSNTQQVVTEPAPQTIVIESSSPSVVYVPTYNPTVVYGTWAYPAYQPYYYYPPGYTAGVAAVSFGVGVACGAAWGYAWGHCNWNRGDVNINVNQNNQFNQNINRQNYTNNYQNNLQNNQSNRQTNRQDTQNNFQNGKGTWQHDASQRGGVPYGNDKAAQKYGGYSQQQAQQARDQFRGRSDQGQQALDKGAASDFRGSNPSGSGRAGAGSGGFGGDRAGAGSGGSGGAFGGMDRGGQATQNASNRGNYSRSGGDASQGRSSGGSNFSQGRSSSGRTGASGSYGGGSRSGGASRSGGSRSGGGRSGGGRR